MARDAKDAVGILRGIKDRVEDLEESVANQEGVPNILRFVTDKAVSDDSVSTAVQAAGDAQWDQDSWDQSKWSR